MKAKRPESLLAGFEIYSKDKEGKYTRHQPCTSLGVAVKHASESALVPLSQKYIFVKLPSHRVFVRQSFNSNYQARGRARRIKQIAFNEITGMTALPFISRVQQLKQSYMSTGSIIELDLASIGTNESYLYPDDINTKIIKPGGYLLAAQLVLLRGQNVSSVAYAELGETTSRIYPPLRRIGDHHGESALLEQAYQDIQRKRAIDKHITYPGSQVLRMAATIHYGNRYLVSVRV
jgi:hypothetical protein